MSLRHSARRVDAFDARFGLRRRRRRHTALAEALEPRRLLTTWYVDAASAGPARNGSSWSAAYADLQLALSAATTGDTIRIAQGTYKPTATTDRTVSFQPPSGVSIYGGYAGTGSPTPDARDPDLYPTTLSGNIGSATSAADNSYHVLYVYYPSATITLDGLNITAGNANASSSPNNSGGGVYYTAGGGSFLIIRQCTFLANAASSGGGGAAFISDGALITNCAFRANTATTYGGALYLRSTFNTVNNCTFVGNSASSAGGAIYAGSSPTVTNCTLAANAAPSGSGLYVGGSGYSPKITNSILWGNTGGSQVGIFLGSAVVTYSDVQAGFAGTGNMNADPAFTRAPSKGADGKWGTADDDYGDLRLQATSPCLDVGSTAAAPTSTTTDLAGRPRLTDVPSVPNGAAGWVDMGAYEYPVSPAVLWFAQPSGQAFENAGSFTVTVRLSSFTDVPVTVPLYVAGGTADASDYSGIPASVVIPAGQPSASFAVNITDGHLIEQPETLLLSFGTPDNAVLGTPATFTLTVLDNDLMYVDAAATTGLNQGSSWSDALTDLQSALAHASAGTIIRVAAGTYQPTTTTNRTIAFVLKPSVAIYGGYAGSARPANPDARDVAAYASVLSGDIGTPGTAGDNSYNVVSAPAGTNAASVLDGFTITGGRAYGQTSDRTAYGGGLNVTTGNASPTVRNCTFLNNSAANGGGAIMSIGTGATTVDHCTFIGNYCDVTGGALGNSDSNLTVTYCTFITNTASGGWGGAIYNSGASPLIVGCAFYANTASMGGAIYNYVNSAPTIANCVFVGNSAPSGSGGAVANNNSSPTVVNCTFVANSARTAGGVYNYVASNPIIANCVFHANVGTAANTSATAAQIVNVNGPSPSVTFCDVDGGYPAPAGSGNLAADPVFLRDPSAGPDARWGTADDDYGDLRLSAASPCVDAGNSGALPAAAASGDFFGGARFVDVGTVGDTGSGAAPVIDIGAGEARPALAATAGGPYAVLRGQPLALTGRGASDVDGPLAYAWEWTGDGLFDDATGPTVSFPSASFPAGFVIVSVRVTDAAGRATVSTTRVRVAPLVARVDARSTAADPAGVTWADAFPSLAGALANSFPGQTIRVAQGTYKPTATTDRYFSFNLRNGVALLGGYAGLGSSDPDARDVAAYPTTLSGEIGSSASTADNSYHVVVASLTDATTILDGFTITAGNANGTSATDGSNSGGGLFDSGGSPTVRNCTFTANAGSFGAAVFNVNAAGSFLNCTFTRNSSSDKGGAMENTFSSPAVLGCTFTGNTASYYGGAVFNSASAAPLIADCTFVGNAAAYGGGAMYNWSASPTVVNCTFVANKATYSGGAVYNESSASPTVTNSVLWADNASAPEVSNADSASKPVITYSLVQRGYAGAGNLDADPRFYRNPSPGTDGKWGTADDDYGDLRLLPGSPAIDAGTNAAVPAPVTTDLAGHPRTIDFPGAGAADTAVVDMGAYEASTDLGTLHLTSGQTVALPAGEYGFTATQLTLDPGAALDLADDSLLIDYAGTSPFSSVRSALASGYANGAWTGTGITSSTARGTSNHAVGYAEAAVLGLTTFNGQPVDDTALLLKYTLTGDANLDGRLTADDYALLDRGRAKVSDNWVFGDFDYDGIVTGADVTLLSRSFAATRQAPDPDAAAPETVDAPAAPDIQDIPPAPAPPATSIASNLMPKTAAVQLSGPARAQRGKFIAFTLKATSVQSRPSTPVRYAIDWNGDGRVDQIVTGRSAASVRHKFGSAGLFNVTVSILDGKGRSAGLREHLSIRVAK